MLIFVVAILSLLVVTGTVFLLMSRQERTGARATMMRQTWIWARFDSMVNQVRQLIYDFTIVNTGTTGNVLLDQPAAWQLYPHPPASSSGTYSYNVGDIIMGSDMAGRPTNASRSIRPRSPYGSTSRAAVLQHGSGTASAISLGRQRWTLYGASRSASVNFDYPNPGMTATSWADTTDSLDDGPTLWLGAGFNHTPIKTRRGGCHGLFSVDAGLSVSGVHWNLAYARRCRHRQKCPPWEVLPW